MILHSLHVVCTDVENPEGLMEVISDFEALEILHFEFRQHDDEWDIGGLLNHLNGLKNLIML